MLSRQDIYNTRRLLRIYKLSHRRKYAMLIQERFRHHHFLEGLFYALGDLFEVIFGPKYGENAGVTFITGMIILPLSPLWALWLFG